MLAGRLIAIARDILADYKKFGVIEILTQAQNLAAQKGSIPDPAYRVQVIELRAKAQSIVNNTQISLYPEELRRKIFSNDFSQVTPERAAQIVLSGISENKSLGMASTELSIYVQNANLLSSELAAILNAGTKLGIEPLTVSKDKISLDVAIPRAAFENQTSRMFNFYLKFSSVMGYFNEISTGSLESPELCYTSTTDPVTGFAMLFAAAGGFLTFYKQLLEVAEKHIGIHKTLKDLRQSGMTTPKNMEEQLSAMIDQKFEEAITKTISEMKSDVDNGRKQEIRTAIRKEGKHLLEAIANGATVSVTIESLDKVEFLLEHMKDTNVGSFSDNVREQKMLEQRIRNALNALGERAPALLSDRSANL